MRALIDIQFGQPGEPIKVSLVDTPTKKDFADLLARGKDMLPDLEPLDEWGINEQSRLFVKGHKGPIPFELDFGLAKAEPG